MVPVLRLVFVPVITTSKQAWDGQEGLVLRLLPLLWPVRLVRAVEVALPPPVPEEGVAPRPSVVDAMKYLPRRAGLRTAVP